MYLLARAGGLSIHVLVRRTAKSRDGQKTTKTVSYSTVPPAGHAALTLRLAAGTIFTDDSVAWSPTGKSNQLLICAPVKGACSSQGNGGNLVIQVPFSKSAPFKKSQHLDLFSGKGESGTLHLYVRGSHNTTETFTWSIAGVLVTHLTVGGSRNGVVTETVSLDYTKLSFQGCSPASMLC